MDQEGQKDPQKEFDDTLRHLAKKSRVAIGGKALASFVISLMCAEISFANDSYPEMFPLVLISGTASVLMMLYVAGYLIELTAVTAAKKLWGDDEGENE